MQTRASLILTGAALAAFAIAAAGMQPATPPSTDPSTDRPAQPGPDDPFADVNALIATVYPTAGYTCKGTVRFIKQGEAVRVLADIEGLAPNSKHGFHIHEFGDASKPDGSSAGGHYNPEHHDHALPTEQTRHAGDLGNLEANADGRVRLDMVTHNISLTGEHNPIIGRGVIIHADPDDGGQPTGNAGSRIGIGVIGIAQH
jgi:Cu-Zn family superoxide dismutase